MERSGGEEALARLAQEAEQEELARVSRHLGDTGITLASVMEEWDAEVEAEKERILAERLPEFGIPFGAPHDE